jgi:hypothetical protein
MPEPAGEGRYLVRKGFGFQAGCGGFDKYSVTLSIILEESGGKKGWD